MQEFNYPDERNNPKIHKKIVENLLKGRSIYHFK